MSITTNTPYRNGLINLGVICGFARNASDGALELHQTSCAEMAFRFDRAEGVRGATQDMEPVTIIYRMLDDERGGQPHMQALHVCRMARCVVPKYFAWNSSDWPRSNTFYPYREDKAGTLAPAVDALLVDEHELPQWLRDWAEQDDYLDEALTKPLRNRRLNSRLVITGSLKRLPVTEWEGPLPVVRALVRQGSSDAGIPIRLNLGTRNAQAMLDLAGESYVTVIARPVSRVSGHPDGDVLRVKRHVHAYEVNVLDDVDVESTGALVA